MHKIFSHHFTKPLQSGLLIAFIAIVLDQLVKAYMLYGLDLPRVRVIELLPFFQLRMAWNTGVSFSMFNDLGAYGPWILSAVALAIVAFVFAWMRKTRKAYIIVGQGLVIGGAMGNVIDRLRFGAVADFFDFFVGTYHWPAFNIADMCIFCGVVLLLIDGFTHKKEASAADKLE